MNSAGTERVCWPYLPVPSAATHARRQLAAQLSTWGIGASDAEPVLLVAYELATNAVEHADTPFELAVTFDGTEVVVEVHDQSTLQPRPQPLDLRSARGRGLQMVAAMAKSWNCIQHEDGKTIRAVIIPGP
jgi:anti-sigma regulatory factor (Ser/Thr protein kinase)